MSEGKVRRVDYSPDEYISGVGGLLSAAEQGVYWMICTLIMSEGAPISNNEIRIAGLCQLRPSGSRKIIDRLIELGKLTVTAEGKLAQKRALSEVEVSQKRIKSAQENGAKGGRPSQKDKEIQHNDKAAGSFPEKLSLTTNYQLSEEEVAKATLSEPAVSDATPPKPTKRKLSAEFEQWYEAYPHKVQRGAAERAFPAALRSASSLEVLLDGVRRYIATKPADRPWQNPATWLNGKGWLDAPAGPGALPSTPITTTAPADWSKRLNYARNNREWSTPRWGPMPGLPDCKVPSDLLELGDGNGWQEMRNVA